MIMLISLYFIPIITTSDWKTDPGECSNLMKDHLAAWYDGTSLDLANNEWYDKSGNDRTGIITGSGVDIFNDDTTTHELYLNHQPIVFGDTSTDIIFGEEKFMNPEHTVFNLCKYRDVGAKERIIQGTEYNLLIGFGNGKSGVCHDLTWITQSSISKFGNDWVLSSERRDLYRGNTIDLTENPQNHVRSTGLAINNGFGTGHLDSDWGCAEIIVVNTRLNISEIQCVERYMNCRYDLGLYSCTTTNPTISSINPTLSPTYIPTISPSYILTIAPSHIPTLSPTFNPTISPTNVPTISPTFIPTISPTRNPTTSVAQHDTTEDIMNQTSATIHSENKSKTGTLSMWMILVIGGIGILAVAVCLAIVYLWILYKKQKNNALKVQENMPYNEERNVAVGEDDVVEDDVSTLNVANVSEQMDADKVFINNEGVITDENEPENEGRINNDTETQRAPTNNSTPGVAPDEFVVEESSDDEEHNDNKTIF